MKSSIKSERGLRTVPTENGAPKPPNPSPGKMRRLLGPASVQPARDRGCCPSYAARRVGGWAGREGLGVMCTGVGGATIMH